MTTKHQFSTCKTAVLATHGGWGEASDEQIADLLGVMTDADIDVMIEQAKKKETDNDGSRSTKSPENKPQPARRSARK